MAQLQNSPSHQNPSIQTTEWRGIEIEVTHAKNWHGCIDHIEVRAKDKAALSITETGYKSQFIPQDRLSKYDDAMAYVLAWLDHEAQSATWKNAEARAAQLSLF